MGTTEIIIIAVVLLIFFGGAKLKDFARGLGESTKEIKKVKKDITEALDDTKKE